MKEKKEVKNVDREPKVPTAKGNSTKKKVFGVIAVVIALGVGFVAIPYVNATVNETEIVYVAKEDIEHNDLITKDMLQEKEMVKKDIPNNTLDISQIENKYSTSKIFTGDIFMEGKVTSNIVEETIETHKDKNIVTITAPTVASGVGGDIKVGDLVSIYAYVEPQREYLNNVSSQPALTNQDISNIETEDELNEAIDEVKYDGSIVNESKTYVKLDEELKYVEIADINRAETNIETETLGSITTVSFYVTPQQAEKIIEIEYSNKVHLVFVARGEHRTEYLAREELKLWSLQLWVVVVVAKVQ